MFAVLALLTAVGCGAGKAKAPPATADAAVTEVAKGLAEDKPQVLWQAMPETYQKDVNDILTTFANGCDPDVYNQSFGVCKKIVLVLQKKKDLIITHPMLLQSGVKQQELAQNWDTVVNSLSVLVNSEISELNKVKTLDVDKFLSGTGSQLMKAAQEISKLSPDKTKPDLKAMLNSVKATLVKTEGDTATVKLEAQGEKPEEKAFKKVEGKWIPKEMADNFKSEMAKANTELQKSLSSSKAQNKDMLISQIKMVDVSLDQMLAAKTADEFNNSVNNGMMVVMGLAMQAGGPGDMSAPKAETPEAKPVAPMPDAKEDMKEDMKEDVKEDEDEAK